MIFGLTGDITYAKAAAIVAKQEAKPMFQVSERNDPVICGLAHVEEAEY